MAKAAEARLRRIEELVRRLDEIPDLPSRDTARSLMEAILELHGAGLERMLDIAFEQGDAGKAAIRRFAADDLVSSLLLLHDLHPDDLETRVLRALAKTPAELVSVFEGVVRVRLTGGGCGLKESVEALIADAAPDLLELIVEERTESPANDFVPLAALGFAVPGTV